MIYRILIICAVFLAASAFIAHASRPEITPVREPLEGIPMRIGDWRGVDAVEFDQRVMDVLGVDDYVNRVYHNPEREAVGLYIGYYQSQRQGDTIHSPLNCLPGAGWNPVQKDRILITPEGNSPIRVNRIVILKGTQKQLVLYWYQGHGRVIASEYSGKFYTVVDALRTNRTDAAMIRVIRPIGDLNTESEMVAEKHAVDFVKALYPLLARYLPS